MTTLARLCCLSRRDDIAKQLNARINGAVDVDRLELLPRDSMRTFRCLAFVVDLVSISPDEIVMAAASLRAARPGLAVVAFAPGGRDGALMLRSVLRAGMDAVILDTERPPRQQLGTLITEARGAALSRVLHPHLPSQGHARLRRLIEACFYNPARTHSVESIARLLRVNRRTLLHWCQTAGALRPEEIVGWCRLVLAAHMIEYQQQATSIVARELRYSTPSGLRNQLRRYTGMKPTDLREDGVRLLLDRFIDRINGRSLEATLAATL